MKHYNSTEYWIIGGEFSSLNFHTLAPETKVIEGPFKTRREAEDIWRKLSEKNRPNAQFRFRIVTVED